LSFHFRELAFFDARRPIYVKCFPYDRSVAVLALRLGAPDAVETPVIFDAIPASGAEGVNLCGVPPARRWFYGQQSTGALDYGRILAVGFL